MDAIRGRKIIYIRFVVNKTDRDSGRRQGLFQIAAKLGRNDEFKYAEEKEYKELKDWFSKNLEKPKSFSTAKRSNAAKVAISWLKPTAIEHIRKMHQFKALLENHGVTVDIIKTDKPGYIVYEDDFQITAEPFADTPR